MVTFIMYSQQKGSSEIMEEEYTKDIKETEVNQWCINVMDNFNATLRQGEKARTYIKSEVAAVNTAKEHKWGKTNLITIIKGGQSYDTYQCFNCNVTSKRFGLSECFKRDGRYNADKWRYCKG